MFLETLGQVKIFCYTKNTTTTKKNFRNAVRKGVNDTIGKIYVSEKGFVHRIPTVGKRAY